MKTKRKHYGRAKNPTFLPYEQALDKVQKEKIESRRQYSIWVNARYRKGMPKHPHAVYKEQWEGWNAFLGNRNSFENRTPKNFREFTDALLYARKSGLTTFENWCQLKHPDDIPVRADIVYKNQWKGWKYFLGTGKYSTTAVVEDARKKDAETLWVISHHQNDPLNILNIRAFNDKRKVLPYLSRNNLNFVRAFKTQIPPKIYPLRNQASAIMSISY